MSLVNNLLSSGKVSNAYGTGMLYKITTADIVALGAFAAGNIVLDNLPPGAVVTYGRIKHSQCVSGGSVSAATVRVATANNSFGVGAFNVYTTNAVSNTALQLFGPVTVTPVGENFAAVTPIYVTFATTGNLNTATAGAIDVWLQYIVLK